MKKALVLAIVMVLGLGTLAFAGPLSGSWESELTIGFRDVTLEMEGYDIEVPLQGTYDVSQGYVTIPITTWTINIPEIGTVDVVIPERKALVGPFTLCINEREIFYDCTDNTIDVCEGCADFMEEGCDSCLTPGQGDEVVDLPEVTDIPVNFGDVTMTWTGTILVTNPSGQTASVTLGGGSLGTQDRSVLCCCGDDDLTFSPGVLEIVLADYASQLPVGFIVSGDNPVFQFSLTDQDVDACDGDGDDSETISGTCGGCEQYDAAGSIDYEWEVTPNTFTLPQQYVSGENICNNEIEVAIPPCTYDLDDLGCEAPLPARELCTELGEVIIPAFTQTFTVEGKTYTITVPEQGPFAVTGQTVTIDDELTVHVSGWSETIERIPTLGFSSTLIVDYSVCGWTFTSTSVFSEDGWDDQSFAAVGTLGAFSIDSELEFDPGAAAFSYWDTDVSVSIAGVEFGVGMLLESEGSGWTFGASGNAGACELSATAYFNLYKDAYGELQLFDEDYCFCFSSVDFDISFPFACIELVDISLGFSNEGFDGVTFSAASVPVPGISFLTLDIDLTFDDGVYGKTLSIVPSLNLGEDCIIIYGELVTGSSDWMITGLNIYGVGLSYDMGQGVLFSSYSSLDPAHNADLTGYADYWEVFSITSDSDSCCGGAFSFALDFYFESTSTALFDFGEMDASISVGLGSNFELSTGLAVSDTAFEQWTIGFKVDF